MRKNRCWKTVCSNKGKINFEIVGLMGEIVCSYFLCSLHEEKAISQWRGQRLGFNKLEPKHTCGLIVCKDCLNNLDEVLDY